MKRCVLIISTGRTGTKFFADFIKRHFRQVSAYHASSHTPFINILGNAYLAGLLPQQALRVIWKLLKEREVLNCPNGIYLDSNNHLYALPVIAPELYPHLKVIHIIRDPRTYVPSHINWVKHRPKSYIAHHFIPFWQPNGFLTGEVALIDWLRMSTFEQFCWIWNYKNSTMEKIINSDIDYYSVRFEDIFLSLDGNKSLNKLLQFAELPPASNIINELQTPVNQAKERTFFDWTNWTPEMCAKMDTICGKKMLDYGYGQEPDWQAKVKLGQQMIKRKHPY